MQLATAWAAQHPAMGGAVIGPRSMNQLQGYLVAENTEQAAKS